jgi:hypothetical protein
VHPPFFEESVNAWTPIELAMLQKDLLNFGCKSGIFSAMLAGLSVLPPIIATFRNVECGAENRYWVLLFVFGDELKF